MASDSEIYSTSRRYVNFATEWICESKSAVATQLSKTREKSIIGEVSNVKHELKTFISSKWSPLHQAANDLSVKRCETLIETEGYDVNLRDSDGATPLMLVCSNRSKRNAKAYALAKYLLNKRANPNIKDNNKIKPFQRALESRNYNLIKLLIERGADQMNLYNRGEWLLYEATKRGDMLMMQKCIEWGCDIFGTSWDGYTALMIAVSRNFCDGVEWLLRAAGKQASELANMRTDNGTTCVLMAIHSGFARILQLLIKFGANCNIPDENQMHPIAVAALNDHPKCVEVLLPHVNHSILRLTDTDPLLAATSGESYESVALLIKAGYPLETPYFWEENIEMPTPYTFPLFDREFGTPLYDAVQSENVPIVKLLIKAGAKMTYTNLCLSPFLLVLQGCLHFDVFIQFLRNDVDINAISDNSKFDVPDALLVSLSSCKTDRLVMLLMCGLDPMLKNWCKCKCSRSLLQDVLKSPDIGDVKKLLELLLYYSPSMPACCNEIADIIGTAVPKVPKLSHLCRLSIRKLFPTSRLLHGRFARNLPIPRMLKDYVSYCHPPPTLSLFFHSLPI